jgi:hypothetical protein
MSELMCPLIVRNVFEATDGGFALSTKLHPCIKGDCALWIPDKEFNVGEHEPDCSYYEVEAHCGLIDRDGE